MQMGGLNDLLTFLSDTDRASIYLLIEDAEQMCSLWMAFFLNNTFIGKSEKGNPCKAKTKGIVFSFKL